MFVHRCLEGQVTSLVLQTNFVQGTLKGEVSLYSWPPVWLV